MTLSNKAKKLISDFKNEMGALNLIFNLSNLKQDEFEFFVEFDIDEVNGIKVLPYDNNTTSSYFNYMPLHYANVLIQHRVDQTLLKKVRSGLKGKDSRLSTHATKVMGELNDITMSQDLELYVDMKKYRDKLLELSTSPKLYNNMRIGIELIKGKEWSIKPVIAFQSDTIITNKDKYTAYAFIRLIEGIPLVKVHKEPYGMFKASLMMSYDIINKFESIADGYIDMNIIERKDVEEVLDNYIMSFIPISSLINTQKKFDKSKAREAFETLLMFKDNANFERFNINIVHDDEDLIDSKGEDMGSIIPTKGISEAEFKQVVKDQLIKYQYEPIRLMEVGEITREPIWIREVAKELKSQMEALGNKPHPSILMTLGEMLPEDLMTMNSSPTTNSNNNMQHNPNVINNGNGTITVDGMVLPDNMGQEINQMNQVQNGIQNGNNLLLAAMQQAMGNQMNMATPQQDIRTSPLGTVEFI